MATVMEEARQDIDAYIHRQAVSYAKDLIYKLDLAKLQLVKAQLDLTEAQAAIDSFDEQKYISEYIRVNY